MADRGPSSPTGFAPVGNGNLALFLTLGNHVGSRGLPGGAEAIQTDGHRGLTPSGRGIFARISAAVVLVTQAFEYDAQYEPSTSEIRSRSWTTRNDADLNHSQTATLETEICGQSAEFGMPQKSESDLSSGSSLWSAARGTTVWPRGAVSRERRHPKASTSGSGSRP
jgi:hypothetical protein